MDAQKALDDLTEISSQIRAAVVFDREGKVSASTLSDGSAFAQAAAELLDAAEGLTSGDSDLIQLDIATGEGSVFVVRQEGTIIAATTGPAPTVGLVFYDLKSALRSLKPDKPRPKPKAPGRKATSAPPARKSATGKKGAAKKAASKKASTKKAAAKRPPERKDTDAP
jgi:predicted regulator of Ras-like GTPase activity (Roadblock/LC7/MglB family)